MGATTIGAKGADRIIVDSQTANPLGDDIAGGVRGHAAERCVKWAVIWAVAVGGLQQKALCSTRNVPHKIFNLYSSIQVNGLPADGYSTGEAIAAIAEVAKETLPVGYGYEFGGITREEAGSGSNTVIIFAICIIFVFLILCALYESIFVPLAVMLSVPFGLMGSFLFAKMWGLENNIYMQTGLIMLIGLLAKTAILLTEYASARRRQGMTIAQAAVSAAGVRLRPILMTALTMIIGLFPLVVASGAGANGNISLGVGTVGGMIVGTLALLFVVPTLFIVFQTLQERLMPARKHEED